MTPLANIVMASGGVICPIRVTGCDTIKNRGLSNPSIIKHNGKTLISFRSCDYTFFAVDKPMLSHQALLWYPTERPPYYTSFNSRNIICELDGDFQTHNPKPFLTVRGKGKFNGYEDIRLSSYNGVLYASASFPTDHGIPIRLCKLNDKYEIESYYEYGNKNAVEKNWMPVLDRKGEFMYLAPNVVIKVEQTKVEYIKNEKCDDTFRGSSQLVPYTLDGKEGYVCVIHRSYINPYKNSDKYTILDYLHKFLFFDKNYKFTHDSDWFKFVGMPVEFTCGMMIDGNDVILPFSVMDSYPFVFKFSTSILDNLLLRKDTHCAGKRDISPYLGDLRRKVCEYIMDEDSDNYAAKIAVSTYLATIAKTKEEAINMYRYAMEILRDFDSAQGNRFTHTVLFQDQAIEQIRILKGM
jgi:hypothetical protein